MAAATSATGRRMGKEARQTNGVTKTTHTTVWSLTAVATPHHTTQGCLTCMGHVYGHALKTRFTPTTGRFVATVYSRFHAGVVSSSRAIVDGTVTERHGGLREQHGLASAFRLTHRSSAAGANGVTGPRGS